MTKAHFGNMSMNFENSIQNLGKKLTERAKKWEKDGTKKMNAAVDIIYNTARAKRPSVTAFTFAGEQMTSSNKIPKSVRGMFKKIRRVSDPDAKFGVPVRTGNLQKSIKKDVRPRFHKIIGTVWVDQKQAPYAKFIEYGTAKIKPRPFFRPAKDLNRKIVKDIIGSEFKE